ncbi:MAG TPA: prepilin-type N-terminal cleavage/methylation domain-containing protein [Gammaproteobacteria bacterium]|nr:prepilin-type N-terminal cleavage/methylation domain-containing protein [Gammaproteobacteria bacterium]
MSPEGLQGGGSAGLTLIELVVAMVIIAIAATAVLGLIATGSNGSADPQLRIRTVELGQSYLDEIFSKRWDERTPIGGGCVQAGGATNCTSGPAAKCPGSCGADPGETRADFDDVDDYDGLQEGKACGHGPLQDASGNDRRGRYDSYCVEVHVATGVGGDLKSVKADDAKRVDVLVKDPRGFTTTFTAYRLNF